MKKSNNFLGAYSYSAQITASNSGWHRHNHNQIIIATEGLILFEDKNSRSILCGENAAFIPEGKYHRTLAMGEHIMFYTVYFSSDCFERSSDLALDLLPEKTTVFRASVLLCETLKKLCEMQQQEICEEPYKTALKFLYFLFCESQKYTLPIALPQTQDVKLKSIINYIDQNYQDSICLALLEKKFFVSRRTIERMFQKHLHMTFVQYLRICRIFHATVFLTTTNQTILEVSLNVGYNSLSAFYSAFQQIVGYSPRKYRLEQ